VSASDLAAARPSNRSVATRAKVVRAAERLFAEKGVGSVSLNEIVRAAEQRHSNVIQYHFGDRDALIQAVIDKHVPGIVAARNAMFAKLELGDPPDLPGAVSAFVGPLAAKLRDPDGGVAFIRFSAQMIAANVQRLAGDGPYDFSIPDVDVLTVRLQRAMTGQNLPAAIVSERLTMAAIMVFTGLGVYAELHGLGVDGVASGPDLDRYAVHLETMILGALTAP
jgi:AcrR family transcriptional regulator